MGAGSRTFTAPIGIAGAGASTDRGRAADGARPADRNLVPEAGVAWTGTAESSATTAPAEIIFRMPPTMDGGTAYWRPAQEPPASYF
ncbi:hypothetical protein GCM10029978_012740 [Actinoallomurus acanthiterrae]